MKAHDMVNNDYFDHLSSKWGYPEEMVASFGVVFSYQGENIALGAKTPTDVTAAWLNSPTHYGNIVNKEYKEIGIGYSTKEDGTVIWVQLFID
jgi:uncharacterized protein YkwD